MEQFSVETEPESSPSSSSRIGTWVEEGRDYGVGAIGAEENIHCSFGTIFHKYGKIAHGAVELNRREGFLQMNSRFCNMLEQGMWGFINFGYHPVSYFHCLVNDPKSFTYLYLMKPLLFLEGYQLIKRIFEI
jgi:hypothetical protein